MCEPKKKKFQIFFFVRQREDGDRLSLSAETPLADDDFPYLDLIRLALVSDCPEFWKSFAVRELTRFEPEEMHGFHLEATGRH